MKELTNLELKSFDESMPIISNSFLDDASAPRLRTRSPHGIPFHATPKALLAASDLADRGLGISRIPDRFHLRQRSIARPRCPGSEDETLPSALLDVA
jgi:hypothetical protein